MLFKRGTLLPGPEKGGPTLRPNHGVPTRPECCCLRSDSETGSGCSRSKLTCCHQIGRADQPETLSSTETLPVQSGVDVGAKAAMRMGLPANRLEGDDTPMPGPKGETSLTRCGELVLVYGLGCVAG